MVGTPRIGFSADDPTGSNVVSGIVFIPVAVRAQLRNVPSRMVEEVAAAFLLSNPERKIRLSRHVVRELLKCVVSRPWGSVLGHGVSFCLESEPPKGWECTARAWWCTSAGVKYCLLQVKLHYPTSVQHHPPVRARPLFENPYLLKAGAGLILAKSYALFPKKLEHLEKKLLRLDMRLRNKLAQCRAAAPGLSKGMIFYAQQIGHRAAWIRTIVLPRRDPQTTSSSIYVCTPLGYFEYPWWETIDKKHVYSRIVPEISNVLSYELAELFALAPQVFKNSLVFGPGYTFFLDRTLKEIFLTAVFSEPSSHKDSPFP